MSDEFPRDKDLTQPNPVDPEPVAVASKTALPPAAILGFLVIVLLAVLVVTSVREKTRQDPLVGSQVEVLQGELVALKNKLNRDRIALGLGPLGGEVGAESLDTIASRLKKDVDTLAALAGSFQQSLMEKDALIATKTAEILRSEQVRQGLASETVRLQGELQRALASETDAELLRRDLALAKSQRDAISAQFASLRQQAAEGNSGTAADLEDLRRKFEETLRAKEFFESRVQALESEVGKSRLFANSEAELLPAAVELFRSLRKLEGVPDSELKSKYSSLGMELNANVLHTLSFATGVSELSTEDIAALTRIVDEVPDGDLVLVIGYASETGNVDSNATLSSNRATAAAEHYTKFKRPGQLVQAVYLGQTDRFSSRIPERNQICEVWHIRKKS